MKTKHTILLACVALVSVFESCSSPTGLSITKRHYRNGYHVEYVSGKHADKSVKETVAPVTPIAANEIKTAAPAQPEIAPLSANETTVATAPRVAPESNTVAAPVVSLVAKKPVKQEAAKHKLATPVIAFEKKQLAKTPMHRLAAKAAQSDEDALSLFWIVILVLILVWAFGLAGGGWGIGWAINVLLLIALILLVLWLLRIV